MATSKKEIFTQSEEDEVLDPTDKVCGVCLKKAAKYTCPRCNIPYCALTCYKSDKHRDCSEMFYKDCFMEGLKDSAVDPEEKRKVMDILSRAENDRDPDDLDTIDDLEERLEDLDLDRDADQVWERLTEQEKKDFEHMIADGRLGNLVEVWTPWWTEKIPVVMETDDSKNVNARPCIKPNIPKLSDLIKTKPSSDARYNLLNILYSYAFICRLHNGDHASMATESADDLMKLSSVLGAGQSFENVHDAMQSCFSRLQDKQFGFNSSLESNLSVMKDVEGIVSCPVKEDPLRFMLMALSDVCDIFKAAQKGAKKQKQGGKSIKIHKQDSDVKGSEDSKEMLVIKEKHETTCQRKEKSDSENTEKPTNEAMKQKTPSAMEQSDFNMKTSETPNKTMNGKPDGKQTENVDGSIGGKQMGDVNKNVKKRKIDNKERATKSNNKISLFQCMKKCEFMLSWTQSYGMSMYNLVPELDMEYALIKADLELFNKTKSELEDSWGGHVKPKKKKLVEEL